MPPRLMSPVLDSLARAFALAGALGALIDGSRPRPLVAPRERSRMPRAASVKAARSSTHALASAARVHDNPDSLAA
jgi:hypothetical protein